MNHSFFFCAFANQASQLSLVLAANLELAQCHNPVTSGPKNEMAVHKPRGIVKDATSII